MAMTEPVRYEGISSRAFEHPADRAASAALASIPLMDKVLKRLSDLGYERRLRQELLGNAVQVGDNQLPSLWAGYRRSADALDIDRVPGLYVTQTPLVNAMTVGAKTPVVVVFSGLVVDYTPAEIDCVLAHELGHVLSEHVYYRTALETLSLLLLGAMPSALVGLPVQALVVVLQEWARAAELSADRASALVAGDPIPVCQMLMRLAGGAIPGMNIDAFIAQATDYDEEDDLFARWGRARAQLRVDHPFAVRRVKELVTWVQQGDFDRIRAGAYVRRGQEPPPAAEFDKAVAHYQARFKRMIEATVGSLGRLKGQLEAWAQGRGAPDRGAIPFVAEGPAG